MKKNWVKPVSITAVVLAVILVAFLFRGSIFSGRTGDRIKELLHLRKKIVVQNDSTTINGSELLKKYYDVFGYSQVWTDKQKENEQYREMLIQMFNYADSLGLERNDYHNHYIVKYDSLSRLPNFDLGMYEYENEVIFTDAALSFLYNVAYGKEIKRIEYNGVKYNIDSTRILNMFSELLVHKDWRRTLDSIEPKISQYLFLKDELNRMTAVFQQYPFLDSTPAGTGKYITHLKLTAYGLLPDIPSDDTVSIELFISAVKQFQLMNNMDTSGTLDEKKFSERLNFPIRTRIEQIKESLNCWRWTGRLKEQEFILVNIPAARLQIVNRDSVRDMSMRVIVGKTETQTPSFTAYITRVITYPYWTVPFSISINEMLPKIIKRVEYLEDNSLQVLNGKGQVIDPKTVNWRKLSKKYFPYTIRQGTGCDNALGLLKFDLNSPFSIYLHDTNRRDLFAKSNRFMSHGCVRVEKPMELAHYLLEDDVDSLITNRLDSCVKDQKPEEFPLKKKFPVLLLYMVADVDENGNLKFYKDIYEAEEKTPQISLLKRKFTSKALKS